MTPADTEPGIEQLRAEPTAPKFKHLKYSLGLAGIFAGALAIRLWFNFSAEHANCAGCCDASEYVRNAAALKSMLNMPSEFWQKFFQTAFNTASAADVDSVRSVMASMKEVYQAGPIFPLFLNFSFAIAGTLFPDNLLGAPILVQSILSAIACCLIADFTSKAWKNSVGFTAGIIAAVYPGFIVNSGRLYTESFATFLVCLTLAIVIRGFFTVQNAIPRGFAAGFLAACLQLTRSILVLLSVILIPLTFVQQKQGHWKKALIALFAGFACVVLPWVCFQHAAFNKGGIVVDRVGNYNLFIGSNTQTQGWLTFPYPDGHGIEKKSLPNLLVQSFETSPIRFIRLMLDKPARLFQTSWNDFRTPIGSFDNAAQTLLHQGVLLFALFGVTLAFFTGVGKESPSRPQMYARFLLGGFAAIHLIYALFITVPRYALTAMPCVISFTAAGVITLASLVVAKGTRRLGIALLAIGGLFWLGQYNNLVQPLMQLSFIHDATLALDLQIAAKCTLLLFFVLLVWTTYSETSGYRRMARIVTTACAILAIPLLVLPGRAAGRWFEWQKPITNEGISQSLVVPKNIGNRQAYLMIDADGLKTLANADVVVNGTKLDGPIIPGMALAQDYATLQHVDNGKVSWEGESIFNYMTRPADLSNLDLRQWFLLPVPKEVTKGSNGKALQVVVKHRDGTRNGGVIFGSFAHGKKVVVPSITTYSWEKAFYGVENAAGLSDPRLDDSLDLSTSIPKGTSTSKSVSAVGTKSASAGSGGIKSGAVKSGATRSGAAKSGASKSGAAKSGAAKSGASKSGAVKSEAAKPGAAKPGAAKPGAAKPGTALSASVRKTTSPVLSATAKSVAAKKTTSPSSSATTKSVDTKAILGKPKSEKSATHRATNTPGAVEPATPSSTQSEVAANPSRAENETAIPNIRLLIAPVGGDGDVEVLKSITPAVAALTPKHLFQPFAIFSMPAFNADDIWIVRTTGDIKSDNQTARPSIDVTANCVQAGLSYQSPWTPMFLQTNADWQHFEISTPVAPGRLPGGIAQLVGNFNFDVPQWKAVRATPDDRVQLRNIKIEIVRLPGNPLAKGYSVQ